MASSDKAKTQALQKVWETRGIRNNNPGNIKYRKNDPWVGQVSQDKDGFAVFDKMEHGYRALVLNGMNRAKANPQGTVLDYVNRFANTSPENERINYAKYINEDPNTLLAALDPYDVSNRQAWFESRAVITPEQQEYVRQMLKGRK